MEFVPPPREVLDPRIGQPPTPDHVGTPYVDYGPHLSGEDPAHPHHGHGHHDVPSILTGGDPRNAMDPRDPYYDFSVSLRPVDMGLKAHRQTGTGSPRADGYHERGIDRWFQENIIRRIPSHPGRHELTGRAFASLVGEIDPSIVDARARATRILPGVRKWVLGRQIQKMQSGLHGDIREAAIRWHSAAEINKRKSHRMAPKSQGDTVIPFGLVEAGLQVTPYAKGRFDIPRKLKYRHMTNKLIKIKAKRGSGLNGQINYAGANNPSSAIYEDYDFERPRAYNRMMTRKSTHHLHKGDAKYIKYAQKPARKVQVKRYEIAAKQAKLAHLRRATGRP